jgi:urease accessory protein
MSVLHCHSIGASSASAPSDSVCLTYDERLLRRKRLTTTAGLSFLLDLPETVSLQHGDVCVLSDGREVGVVAAQEPLMAVTGDLPRLAWHIGNRHAPCQIEAARLLLQRDKVLRAMLEGLGAQVLDVTEPFLPDGGAYGHGRTMGHEHAAGHGAHTHRHDAHGDAAGGDGALAHSHGGQAHSHGKHGGHAHSHDDATGPHAK